MELPQTLLDFLAAQTTLTLATTNEDGSPHSCDLFYVRGDKSPLYFLSDPKTRHIQNLTRNPQVSVTIHGTSHGWQDIRGVQIVGEGAHVDNAMERTRGFSLYLVKYVFVCQWLPNVAALGQTNELFGVIELYKIEPHWMRWFDNEQGFGHKEDFSF